MTATVVASELHDRLANVVASVLRVSVESVAAADSFASLGMDSLAAVELSVALQDELGIEVPLHAVHEYPDLESLCRFIETGVDASRSTAQLRADALLPADIVPGHGGRRTRDARDVFLTGATGFVGAFLLRSLLDETSVTTHCLVRGGEEGGLDRVRRNLEHYGLWSASLADRIRVVAGDVSQPRLGLSERQFRVLASRIDAIYHVAADVNWVYGYDALRDANVLGTGEAIRLAVEGAPKPLHFVSSASVCHSTAGPRLADETTNVYAAVDGLRLGYAQSKCVAEELVRQAGARGLPVTIIRPSLVTGDVTTGRSNVADLTARFIAGCIALGAAPDLDWRMDCVPVDYVARSIVRLSREHERGISVLHVTADRPRHWRECVLWMRLRGYAIELVPYRDWMELVRVVDNPEHPLFALRSFFLRSIAAENHLTLPELFEEKRRTKVDSTRTQHTLGALGSSTPRLTSRLLSRYFDDFIAQGIVPPASRHHTAEAQPLALPGCDERLVAGLSGLFGETIAGVPQVVLTAVSSDDSIIAELTAWHSGTSSGLYRAEVACVDVNGHEHRTRAFVKSKAADTSVVEVAAAVAALASPQLGVAVSAFAGDIGITRSHIRELALYSVADDRMRDHTPRVLLIDRDDENRRWLLALESIEDAVLIDATDPADWTDGAIETAIAGLAQIHSVWYNRAAELSAEPWLAPIRNATKRIELQPLWMALAEHASRNSDAWSHPRLRSVHDRVLATLPAWAAVLDRVPHTLVHNDFNPRNIAIRPAGGGLRLCAFDWELATVGAPQRDLAELLCFVLPPEASQATARRWVEWHRTELSRATKLPVARDEWEAGFGAALCDLLIDRLAFYAMIDRIRPQTFLPRVVRSWMNLFECFGSESLEGRDSR